MLINKSIFLCQATKGTQKTKTPWNVKESRKMSPCLLFIYVNQITHGGNYITLSLLCHHRRMIRMREIWFNMAVTLVNFLYLQQQNLSTRQQYKNDQKHEQQFLHVQRTRNKSASCAFEIHRKHSSSAYEYLVRYLESDTSWYILVHISGVSSDY